MTIPYMRNGDTITFGTGSGDGQIVVGTCPACSGALVPNLTPDPKAPSMRCIKCPYKGEGK
jgi:hypothetical protein